MMIRSGALVCALALAACATGKGPARDLADPSVQRLLIMPTPAYYATLTLAAQVAQNCARYRYDAELDSLMNERRNALGHGSLSAHAQRSAITVETDVSQRSFMAKHGVTLQGADLCPAADAEILQGSALGALLVPL
ncbi:hypothetical protein [Yoonia vestfoldensis]|uniref:Lipoprotein n=1 Tax=Yoonia vestfoldensis TaxID=245188 RepID=A0A1Y0ECJ8_9RHOB|nr:hypothetical protein [Yoonia vestfoldensis]ARU01109.1 hypothetical protein LOKVESSMR4R_01796 [Yoonia vestfoldensis]